jgi:plastocyanin domain-containing protein
MKYTFFLLLGIIVVGSGVLFFSSAPIPNTVTEEPIKKLMDTTGKQVIELVAKDGFTPRKSVAVAGKPAILRINTEGTFDCSSTVRIPSMNIVEQLPISGITDIDLGTPQAGTLNGTCGMGMYPFEIEFK